MTDAPRSEPLGGRQATGDPNGWKYDRHSKPAEEISTAQVPQEPLGDQDRGRRA